MASEVVRDALSHVLRSLENSGNPYALIGGVALAVWNHPRATRDVDLLIGVESGHVDALVNRLRESGYRPKRTPPVLRIGDHRFVQFLYSPPGEFYDVQIDLLLADTELQKSALARRVIREVQGLETPIEVLACDDLILFKLLAGRMIDRADAATLLRENRDDVDEGYLRAWVERLGLTEDLDLIWHEAFPGEDMLDESL